MIEISIERKDAIKNYIFPKIWALNPTGNFEQVSDYLVEKEKLLSPRYTAEIICQKYVDYYNKWSYEHDGQEERYISKDDKLIDIYQFLVKNMFHNDYSVARKGRDQYLFGDWSKEKLQQSVDEFLRKMSYGRK